MKYIIYDIETLKNISTFCFLSHETGNKKQFILFDDIKVFNELIEFLYFLKRNKYYLVGFNNLQFDAQILEEIIELYEESKNDYVPMSIESIIMIIYIKAQKIISSQEERFSNNIPEWKLNIPQIDLFKQKHYDRPAKATSLKWIQFSMNYYNIEEMPIHHNTEVTKEDIPSIISYNWNDVDSTYNFFKEILFETEIRNELSEKFNLHLLNASEPKIARDILGKFLSKEMGITYKELKELNTIRDSVVVKDIIFPYIKFNYAPFKDLLTNFNNLNLKLDDKFEHIISAYGLKCTIALGGLHSVNTARKVIPNDNQLLITSDVTSFYPNLAIQNNLKPEHLGNIFLKVYSDIYQERKKYDKKHPISYVYKIILNATYGLSGEPNSYLYDYQFTRSICINGQLSLLMLMEYIKDVIPNVEFVMANTDGVEALIDKKDKETYLEACKKWEETTKLELEHGEYKAMYIRDCNNYMAIDNKDSVKSKGTFQTKLDYHKNPSFLIIPKAVEEYFINGIKPKEFITSSTNIYDFCGGVKRKSNFDLNLHIIKNNVYKKESQQKVTRYFVSNGGGQLIKDFHDGKQVSVLANYSVEIANKIEDTNAMNYNINRKWYIKETLKLINLIEASSLQLKLF